MSRIYEQQSRHVSAVGLYQRGRQKELDESSETYFEEVDAHRAVLNERVGLAKAAYVAKFTGLTAAFAYCLAKSSGTGPLTPGAYLLCSGTYTAGVAAVANELRNEVADANSDFADK